MRIQPEFPEYRQEDPLRGAELRVYQEIVNAQQPGQALYEVKASRHSPEVDFAVWVEDVACFSIEVKGGNYWVENGTLFRQGHIGPEQVANPLRKAMDGALSIRNAINDRLPSGACYIISILLFPDMERTILRSGAGPRTPAPTSCLVPTAWSGASPSWRTLPPCATGPRPTASSRRSPS